MTGPHPTFEPETIRAMQTAFEEACDSLQLTHRSWRDGDHSGFRTPIRPANLNLAPLATRDVVALADKGAR
jgi:hypothetical protein